MDPRQNLRRANTTVDEIHPRPPGPQRTGTMQTLTRVGTTVVHHVKKHVGVGIVCAVAYFDPGNWGVDLAAGSQFGYRLLFVVLLAGLFAVFLQVLATRLGTVTGLDLATHSRLLLYNRPKHTLFYRWACLYPLYVLAEVAIIATDLAELLGSAIALCLLFPSLELWHGVLITAFDVILILGLGDPLRGKPVKAFEWLISGMVLAVLICMVIIIAKVDVNWADAFKGYLPSKHIFAAGGVYTSVGILGATVMPHSLFLGSALATQDRMGIRDEAGLSHKDSEESLRKLKNQNKNFFLRYIDDVKVSTINAFRTPPASEFGTVATNHKEHTNNTYNFVRAHIYHGTFDIIGSLLGFAVMINSLILMLASAVFFFGPGNTHDPNADPASLFDAYFLIEAIVGKPAAILFAIALLSAGQSSSIIATVAGQAVSEGFLQWRTSAAIRRVLTRLIAIIPSMTVAIAVGRSGIDALLIASQVVLSVVLPFVSFPLLYCTSSKAIMSVRKSGTGMGAGKGIEGDDNDEIVDYSNNKLTIAIASFIWLIIVAANFYVLVELAMGKTG